jgi:alpha-ketoglutarate-dependent 2,4-dichlorophenoxyacetate dioxygenase
MRIAVKQLHSLFVGEVSGVDLRQPIDDATFAEIQAAIDEHAVLVFHGQPLSEAQQIAFSTRFGPIEGSNNVLRSSPRTRLDRQLVDISNLDEDNAVLSAGDRRRMFALGNQLWHTDSSFKRTPAKYSLLHAHVVTPEGGETEFVDMRAAYDALPAATKAKIDGLVAEHSIFHSRSKLGFTEFSAEERAALPPVPQVVVRVHPGSGRKTLYLASHASHIVGWHVPDGRMLIHDLIEHATQPQFVYRHTWKVGDLVIWDNRCTMHRGRPYDEAHHRRDLRRATIEDVAPTVEQVRVA